MSEVTSVEVADLSHIDRAKELLYTLPVKGVILHGTVAKNTEGIKRDGLGKSRSDKIDYFSFLPPDKTSADNLTVTELKKIRERFEKSVEENIFWSLRYASLRGFYDQSFSEFPDSFIMDFLPAVVVAKKPEKVREVVRKDAKDKFDWERSGPIPAKDILMIVSLTKEEFDKIKAGMSGSVPSLVESDSNPELAQKVKDLDEEAKDKTSRVIARKILHQLLVDQKQLSPSSGQAKVGSS